MTIKVIQENFDEDGSGDENSSPKVLKDLSDIPEDDLARLAAGGEEDAIFEIIKRNPELGGGLEWDKVQ